MIEMMKMMTTMHNDADDDGDGDDDDDDADADNDDADDGGHDDDDGDAPLHHLRIKRNACILQHSTLPGAARDT